MNNNYYYYYFDYCYCYSDQVRKQEELGVVWQEVKDRKAKHREVNEMIAELRREVDMCKGRLKR